MSKKQRYIEEILHMLNSLSEKQVTRIRNITMKIWSNGDPGFYAEKRTSKELALWGNPTKK